MIETMTPNLKFTTNEDDYCLEHEFDEWIRGKFITIKFIDA